MRQVQSQESFVRVVVRLALPLVSTGILLGSAAALQLREAAAWMAFSWLCGFWVAAAVYKRRVEQTYLPLDQEDLEATTFYNAKNSGRDRRGES
jgi:hypothetical protein